MRRLLRGHGGGLWLRLCCRWAWGPPSTPYWGPYYGPAAWGHWGYVNVNAANVYGRWGGNAVVHGAWGVTPYGTEWAGRNAYGNTARGTEFQAARRRPSTPTPAIMPAGARAAITTPIRAQRARGRRGRRGQCNTGNYAAGREQVHHPIPHGPDQRQRLALRARWAMPLRAMPPPAASPLATTPTRHRARPRRPRSRGTTAR